jgi:hypothetical protein
MNLTFCSDDAEVVCWVNYVTGVISYVDVTLEVEAVVRGMSDRLHCLWWLWCGFKDGTYMGIDKITQFTLS